MMADYLLQNSVELVVIGVAFCFSKYKLIPGFLVLYVSIMTVTFSINQDCLDSANKFGIDDRSYNFDLMLIYGFESFVMIMLAIVSMFNKTRMQILTTVTIFSQSLVSSIAAISVGFSWEFYLDMDYMFEVHDLTQDIYVIIYCVIAWTCVYYSRMKNI